MKQALLSLPYITDPIQVKDLKVDKAIDFADALNKGRYAKLLRCERSPDGDEFIYFEIEPEIGQNPEVDIRYKEVLAAQFFKSDTVAPYVYALREDFPLTLHLNSMFFEKPVSLCLYETPYTELKHKWRGIIFLERIREWLMSAATNQLHLEDQPLEPFLLDTLGNIIIPADLKEGENVYVVNLDNIKPKFNLVAFRPIPNLPLGDQKFLTLSVISEPQVHGYLRKTPLNLFELDELLQKIGVKLIEDYLKPKLLTLNLIGTPTYRDYRLVIILSVPKKRSQDQEPEVIDITTFLIVSSLKELALATMLLSEESGMLGLRFPKESYKKEDSEKIIVGPLRTYKTLTKSSAQHYSGIKNDEIKIGMIGLGAIGSQIITTLSRMGFGSWRVMDYDILLSHNLVRHSLMSSSLGQQKSLRVATELNSLLNDPTHCIPLIENYLRPNDINSIKKHFADVNLIIDTSASVAVSRKLALDQSFHARRTSIFLNPQGSDLVMLVEPTDRNIRLDHLEMQYYRMIWQNDTLNHHLMFDGKPIRYSASCRDITSTIRQEDVVIFSGIGAKAIRNLINDLEGNIIIWKINGDGAIEHISNKPFPVHELEYKNWRISFDDYLLDKIRSARKNKLPNETGGVLLGSYDMVSKTIYVVDSILSPKDSKEYPNSYYRGIDGLGDMLQTLSKRTAQNLQYVGEWHSHPDGSSVSPSQDDLILLNWIEEFMDSAGLPSLMFIIGENDQLGIYM